MADKITIFYPQRRNVDSCFDCICLVCLAAAEAAKTKPAPVRNPEAVVSGATL
jgi:hypothetical protein